jgi:hypothetical protein
VAKWKCHFTVTETGWASSPADAVRRFALLESACRDSIEIAKTTVESVKGVYQRLESRALLPADSSSMRRDIWDSEQWFLFSSRPSWETPEAWAVLRSGAFKRRCAAWANMASEGAVACSPDAFERAIEAVVEMLGQGGRHPPEEAGIRSAVETMRRARTVRLEGEAAVVEGLERKREPSDDELRENESLVTVLAVEAEGVAKLQTLVGPDATILLNAVLRRFPIRLSDSAFWCFGRDLWGLSRQEEGLDDDEAQVVIRAAADRHRTKFARLHQTYQEVGESTDGVSEAPGATGSFSCRASADETIARLLRLSPEQFEQVASQILASAGLSDVRVEGRTGDGGIDARGVLALHRVLKVHVAVQIKRWQDNVQAPVVRDLRGALHPGEHGLIVTTSGFSDGARDEASRAGAMPIHLIDGYQLVLLLQSIESKNHAS